MKRYVVIDTDWEDDCPSPMGRGRQVGSFRKPDSATALALQRMACGDLGVVVVDIMSGKQVFPAVAGNEAEGERPSATRLRSTRGLPAADKESVGWSAAPPSGSLNYRDVQTSRRDGSEWHTREGTCEPGSGCP
jgi:hypothetical protein